MVRSGMSGPSRETLAIIGVGVALAALILTSTASVRGEIRAVRDEARAERQATRAETRADRGAFQGRILRLAEGFQSRILRLTEQQGVPSARIEGLRDPPAANP